MNLLIYCDGACENKNPGGWGVGGWVVKDETGETIADGARNFGCYPSMTNNIAEYGAVKAALDFVLSKGWQDANIVLRSDSQLVIKQVNDEYRTQSPTLRPLRDQIWALLEKFTAVKFEWVPREQNVEADTMSRAFYKREYFRSAPTDIINDRSVL